ncbi:MAG TPA: Mu transposase C-terminal domain-containing protein [Chloroflexia bacterium]|jgi:putative transposase
MAGVKFEPDTRYLLDGQAYTVRQKVGSNRLLVENESSGAESTVEIKALRAAWVGKRLKLETPGEATRKAALRERFATPGPDRETTRVLERVVLGHIVLDVLIVDEESQLVLGRPTVTVAIDDFSEMPFGVYVGLDPPSYLAVMGCLLHGILEKHDVQKFGTDNPWPVCGLPEVLVMNGGKELVGRDLENACTVLGITLVYTPSPARTAGLKAAAKRAFSVINAGLLHALSGTVGGDGNNSADGGDGDGKKYPRISISAFLAALHRYLVDEYAQTWHSEKGCIPAVRWQDSIQAGFRPMLPDSAEVLILLAPTLQRKLQRAGIEFEGMWYSSPNLAWLGTAQGAPERVSIKYDPSNLGHIYVNDSVERTGGIWRQVPAVDQKYAAGLSLVEHRAFKRLSRATRDAAGKPALLALDGPDEGHELPGNASTPHDHDNDPR